MEFCEIYCKNCKKVLGKYNTKYFSEEKIGELIKTNYDTHVKSGHHLELKIVNKK